MNLIPKALEVAAQIWCDPRVSNREMDTALCQVIAEALTQYANAVAEERVVGKVKEIFSEPGMMAHWKNGVDYGLEEAAKIVDKPVDEPLVSRIPGYVLAERIRALKSKEGA